MHQCAPGETIIDQFPVFDDDGYTKISGLLAGDFTVNVWADAVPQSTVVTLSEIGTSGEYKLAYVPAAEGYWKVEIMVNFNNEIMVSDAQVAIPDLVEILAQFADVKDELNLIKDGNTGLFTPADSLHMHSDDLARVLGLLHYNAIVDNETYDSNTQLSGARLRVFDSRSHVPATPGGSETLGLLHQYEIDAEYGGMGVVRMYRLRRVL